jgi:hypothetical protein
MLGLSALQSALLILLTVVLLWFAFGRQRNIRKGNDALKWLQGGLPLLGKRTTLKWLGSTAMQLNITDPRAPLSEAEVLVVLEPRDLGWLWAWSIRRGRRDFLIIRGGLQGPPSFELEAGDAAGWTREDRLKRLDWGAWSEADWGSEGIRVAHSADADPELIRPMWEDLRSLAGSVWRLSVRRDNPHLEVHVPLPDVDKVEVKRVIQAFVELARNVATR